MPEVRFVIQFGGEPVRDSFHGKLLRIVEGFTEIGLAVSKYRFIVAVQSGSHRSVLALASGQGGTVEAREGDASAGEVFFLLPFLTNPDSGREPLFTPDRIQRLAVEAMEYGLYIRPQVEVWGRWRDGAKDEVIVDQLYLIHATSKSGRWDSNRIASRARDLIQDCLFRDSDQICYYLSCCWEAEYVYPQASASTG